MVDQGQVFSRWRWSILNNAGKAEDLALHHQLETFPVSGLCSTMKLQESSQTKFLWTVAMLEVMMMAIYVLLVRSTTSILLYFFVNWVDD